MIHASSGRRDCSRCLPERPDILEIGCGAASSRRRRSPGSAGSRASTSRAAQIDRARKALPAAELIHGDVTTATFAASSFDAVVALYTLTHVPAADLPALLGRVRDVATARRPVARDLRQRGGTRERRRRLARCADVLLGVRRADERAPRPRGGPRIIESRLEVMHEPESEPGQGDVDVAFHWILARKER